MNLGLTFLEKYPNLPNHNRVGKSTCVVLNLGDYSQNLWHKILRYVFICMEIEAKVHFLEIAIKFDQIFDHKLEDSMLELGMN